MIKYNDVRLVYTCAAAPILGIQLDRSYRILKKNDVLFVTDGNAEIEIDEFVLKMLFTPTECEWNKVNFSDEIVKQTKTK
jgi:hypothetical protein